MKAQELIKQLTKDGWQTKNQPGSHVYLAHQTKPGKITIPYHNKDLKPGTLN